MEEDKKCYFPSDITIEKEFITGFGKKELKRTVKGSFIGLVVALAVYTITANILASMSFFIFFSVGTGFLCIRPQGMNLSFIDDVKNLINYVRSQKVFLFQYLDEWR